jgi:hypothetical protein
MPIFYFILKNGHRSLPDTEGVELLNEEAARAQAVAIGRELMRHNELERRSWRLEVRDDYLHPCFELPFAEIDDSIKWAVPRKSPTRAEVVRTSHHLIQFGRDYLQWLGQQRSGSAALIDQSRHAIAATRELLRCIDVMVTVCIYQPDVPHSAP